MAYSSAAVRDAEPNLFHKFHLKSSFDIPSKEDLNVLAAIMKRRPRQVLSVSKRCEHNIPMAIISSPIMNGKPFPSMFWLTCRRLIRECGWFEAKGCHRKIELYLKRDFELRKEMLESQEKFRSFRAEIANLLKIEIDIPQKSADTGIAGTSCLLSVKCLHAHTAAHLSGIPTPASKLIVETIGDFKCGEPCLEL